MFAYQIRRLPPPKAAHIMNSRNPHSPVKDKPLKSSCSCIWRSLFLIISHRAQPSLLLQWLETFSKTSISRSHPDHSREELNDSPPPRSRMEVNRDLHPREARGQLNLSSSPSLGSTGSWLRIKVLQTLLVGLNLISRDAH